MQEIRIRAQEKGKRLIKNIWAFIRKRYKGILYYAAMAVVLTLLAAAAESYRTGREGAQPLVLTDNIVKDAISGVRESGIYPEGMRLVRGFSDEMEWNAALGQWEMHCANDYAFENDQVICLMGGSVADVGESGERGGFIEINGNDGCLYRYSSVIPCDQIAPGAEIAAGDIIAEADNAMPSEFAGGNHVHLEVYKNGILSDYELLCEKSNAVMD